MSVWKLCASRIRCAYSPHHPLPVSSMFETATGQSLNAFTLWSTTDDRSHLYHNSLPCSQGQEQDLLSVTSTNLRQQRVVCKFNAPSCVSIPEEHSVKAAVPFSRVLNAQVTGESRSKQGLQRERTTNFVRPLPLWITVPPFTSLATSFAHTSPTLQISGARPQHL